MTVMIISFRMPWNLVELKFLPLNKNKKIKSATITKSALPAKPKGISMIGVR
jgi:hypothetical protein